MKQAIKKGSTIKKKSISDWKEKAGLYVTAENLEVSNADKPIDWLIMPKAWSEATRLPGFPLGYISMIGGFSDTGKTTILNHVLVAAQRQGYIPVIYDTENNMDWKYLTDMGFEATPIYGEVEIEKVDNETGEVTVEKENRIIGYDGEFIYFNNTILAAKYGQYDYSTGKETKTKRKEAVIEDIAASMKELLDAQDSGEIEQGFVFVWDSIGSINSYKSYKSVTNNNMFDAGSVSVAFSNILNNRIPSSRKMSSPYTNTMVAISKIWLDSMSAPMAAPTVKYKNGNTFFYACHGLIVHVGGALTSGTKKLKAVSKGATYRYGLETKVKIVKNHLPSPYNLTYEGNMICTAHGLIDKDDLVLYQKEHITDMLEQLNQILKNKTVEAEDIVFTEEDDE